MNHYKSNLWDIEFNLFDVLCFRLQFEVLCFRQWMVQALGLPTGSQVFAYPQSQGACP